jgi:hypothetical protein
VLCFWDNRKLQCVRLFAKGKVYHNLVILWRETIVSRPEVLELCMIELAIPTIIHQERGDQLIRVRTHMSTLFCLV